MSRLSFGHMAQLNSGMPPTVLSTSIECWTISPTKPTYSQPPARRLG